MNQDEIVNILEKDFKHQIEEIKKHKELSKIRKSKKQKHKARGHMHKIIYIKELLEKLNYRVCPECGSILKK